MKRVKLIVAAVILALVVIVLVQNRVVVDAKLLFTTVPIPLALLLLATLLVGIVGGFIGQLGIIACVVGVFATQALVLFAMPLVVDRKMDFWPAIQMSMDKVKENLVAWSVFVLAIGALQLLGAIICGVGTLVTAPIAMVAIALAYRDNFGIQGAAGAGAAAPPSAPQVPPTVPPTPPSPTA